MKLLKQIAELFKQLKVVAGVITSVVIISGATLWITKTSNGNQEEQTANFDRVFDTLAVMNQNIEYLSIENSSQDEQLQGIHDTLLKIDKDNESQGQSIRALTWAIQNQEDFTPDQLREIMDEMLKKNYVMEKWDLEWPDWWIVQPPTDLILSKAN